MEQERIRKFKWLVSLQKERKWLEEMALQGWFLENITLGICYTFAKGEPKRMLYDIDRFTLPKKPKLEEIRHKEMFLDMAKELGWREVTHDETMVYYFAKEYEEGGINELHNDPESRRYVAEKFRNFLTTQAKTQVFWGTAVLVIAIFEHQLQTVLGERWAGWFEWFTVAYVLCCNCLALHLWKTGLKVEKELSMSRQEWEESTDPATHKTVRKLILTIRRLNKFLRSQEEQGWVLTGVTPTRYFFEKSRDGKQVYTMDSKSLTNKRRRAQSQEKFQDSKDWNGINNDWEIQSTHDAEAKGWTFVCALENRAIIYRGDPEKVQLLNDAKYDNSLRGISLIGEYGFIIFCCGLLGGLIGMLLGWKTFW